MKKILLVVSFVAMSAVAAGTAAWMPEPAGEYVAVLRAVPTGTPQAAYISKYSSVAVSEMHRSGVPASITLAQGLLESNSGRSELAVKGNNHFGIKCHDWKGRRIYFDDDRKHECFRKYSHAEESFRDHSDFLRYRDRYKFLFDLKTTDYKGWAYGLKKAGYATDPAYPQKLIKLIEEYDLTRFDTGRKAGPKGGKDERDKGRKPQKKLPESPTVLEQAVPVKTGKYEEFAFSLSRQLYSMNKVPFVYSAEGETFASIAKSYGLFPGEILRYNDAKAGDTLLPGTVVYLQPKKNRAPKHVDKHIADENETLRDISQRYAVKLKRLMKLNGLGAGAVLKNGDTVVLR